MMIWVVGLLDYQKMRASEFHLQCRQNDDAGKCKRPKTNKSVQHQNTKFKISLK